MKKIVDEEAKRREICTKLYDKARGIQWDLTQEEFSIDENFNFTHATWRGTYVKGGDNVVATVEIICTLRNVKNPMNIEIYHLFTL